MRSIWLIHPPAADSRSSAPIAACNYPGGNVKCSVFACPLESAWDRSNRGRPERSIGRKEMASPRTSVRREYFDAAVFDFEP